MSLLNQLRLAHAISEAHTGTPEVAVARPVQNEGIEDWHVGQKVRIKPSDYWSDARLRKAGVSLDEIYTVKKVSSTMLALTVDVGRGKTKTWDFGWWVPAVSRQDTHVVMDEAVEGFDWIAVDGDHIGDAAATPLLDDDEVEAAHVSDLIHQGQVLIQKWCVDHGGIMVVNGGDNALFKMKPDGYHDFKQFYTDALENLRIAYHDLTNFTLSCGVGKRPSEADKSLMVAKELGRDRIVFYNQAAEDCYQKIVAEEGSTTEMDESTDRLLIEGEDAPAVTTYTPPERTENAPIGTSYQQYKQRKKPVVAYFKPSKTAAALSARARKTFKGEGKDEEAMVLRMSRRVAKRLSMSDVVARKLLSMINKHEKGDTPKAKEFIQLLGGVKMAREVRRFLDTNKNLSL